MKSSTKHPLKKVSMDSSLRSFITPLTTDEKEILKQSLLKEGCRDPLIVWKKDSEKIILVDGHNRFELCTQLDIPFQTLELKFNSRDDVLNWMIDNQLGRRNLSSDQISYYRGLKYLRLKRKKGGYDNVKSKGQNVTSTAERLALEFNVSDRTIKRDAEYAHGLDLINKSNPELKNKILSGKTKINKSYLRTLATSNNPPTTIKNEADLNNKVTAILKEIEAEMGLINNLQKEENHDKVTEFFASSDLLTTKEDRLKLIKGKILSQLNIAINNADPQPLSQVRKLVDNLEGLLSKGQAT